MRPLILKRKAQAAPQATARPAEPELTIAQKAARKVIAEQAQTQAKVLRDPAPSRAAYKMRRLWLTPFFRQVVRIGAPLTLSFIAGVWYFGNDDRRGAIYAGVMDIRRSVETRPEFMVQLVSIEGVSPKVAEEIREAFPIELPISSFDLNLEVMQAEMAELDVIETAALRIRAGGVLEIALRERQPSVLWRSRMGLALLDQDGIEVSTAQSRMDRPDLPLLAGEGAQDNVAEALDLIRIAAPIATRLRGLVRVGNRRWDIALTGGQTILLPETNPVSALQQVIALNQAQDLLARDLTTIDMRNPLRPTLRMAETATAEMHRIKLFELGEPPK